MKLELRHAALLRRAPDGAQRGLHPVELCFAAGEHVAIVGPSGAGKTTLLQLAACALRPDSGQVFWDGADPWALSTRERQRRRAAMFFAPQVPPLPPRQRVVTAVLAGELPTMGFWRSLRSLVHPLGAERAYAALQHFGLGSRLFDRVDRLSGGERQRVSLARALLSPARVWLLDEPLAALDPSWAGRALQALRAQARQRGATLIVAMHQVELARANFPRLIGLRAGRVHFDHAAGALDAAQWSSLYAGEVPVPEGALPLAQQGLAAAPPLHLPWR